MQATKLIEQARFDKFNQMRQNPSLETIERTL